MKKIFFSLFFTFSLLFSQINYNVSLYGHMDKYTGGNNNNDYSEMWGWTDTVKNHEYAIIGTTYGTSIVDITTQPIQEVDFLVGPPSNYNYQEFKTYKNYLYIGSEGSDIAKNAGIQIVDLSTLPDSASLKKTYVWLDTTNVTTHATKKYYRAHTVSIEKNFLYVNGGDFGGTRIMDISDPLNPLQVGSYGKASKPYVHDAIIRNDTLYASCINAGTLDIVDFTKKSHITKTTAGAQLVSSTPTVAEGRTHQSWLSEDGNYLFVATETSGGYLHIYDIHDRTNPIQIATWASNATTSIHNVFVKGDFLYIAYYADGFRVLDIKNPHNPIEVAFYDTYPTTAPTLYQGAWGAYPYFPSGKIAVSDMNTGLYIFTVDLKYGGNIIGIVKDAVTNIPLGNADVKILETGRSVTTSVGSGIYKYGTAEGEHHVLFSKAGYISDTISITTQAGTMDTVYVTLQPGTSVNVEKIETTLPTAFHLYQNYPNPFNPNTIIRFSIEKDNFTSLRIFNTVGQEMATVVDQKLSAGTYSVNVNAAKFPSGIYFYTLTTGSFSSTKKMVLTK